MEMCCAQPMYNLTANEFCSGAGSKKHVLAHFKNLAIRNGLALQAARKAIQDGCP